MILAENAPRILKEISENMKLWVFKVVPKTFLFNWLIAHWQRDRFTFTLLFHYFSR
jgi:hypothetical protein